MLRNIVAVAILVSILLLSGCMDKSGPRAQEIRISGSTTVMPLIELCAEVFNVANETYRVSVTGGGSGVGINDLGEGRSSLAMTSREVKQDEKQKFESPGRRFREIPVGYDGIVVVVSSKVYESGVTAITMEQLRAIYSGQIRNWKELGGSDRGIFAISRKSGSGTRDNFNEMVMGKKEAETPGAEQEAGDSSEVKTALVGGDNGIGYVGFSYVTDGSIRPLALEGTVPTIDTLRSGKYPLARKLFLCSLGNPSPGAQAFIDFVIGPEGQKIALENGFIPL